MIEPQTTVKQKQEQTATVRGGIGYGHWLPQALPWLILIAIMLVGIGVLTWLKGGWLGQLLILGIILLGTATLGYLLLTWGAERWFTLKRLALNSNVVETQHVSVMVWPDGDYTNFSAEVAAAQATGLYLKHRDIKQIVPYKEDTPDQAQDRYIHALKTYDGLTWGQVQEQAHVTEGIARGAVKRHQARLDNHETYDARDNLAQFQLDAMAERNI